VCHGGGGLERLVAYGYRVRRKSGAKVRFLLSMTCVDGCQLPCCVIGEEGMYAQQVHEGQGECTHDFPILLVLEGVVCGGLVASRGGTGVCLVRI
jgi:hypothetical protein